jgi:hypothetical protein
MGLLRTCYGTIVGLLWASYKIVFIVYGLRIGIQLSISYLYMFAITQNYIQRNVVYQLSKFVNTVMLNRKLDIHNQIFNTKDYILLCKTIFKCQELFKYVGTRCEPMDRDRYNCHW